MNLLYVTNGAAVGIFGMVLSGAFCDIHWTKEKREFLVGSIFVLLAIQGVMYLLAGAATIRYLYPVIDLIKHFPRSLRIAYDMFPHRLDCKNNAHFFCIGNHRFHILYKNIQRLIRVIFFLKLICLVDSTCLCSDYPDAKQ